VESDPLSASARGELARALLVNGRCDEALGQLALIADLQPRLLRASPIAAQCYAQEGMWDEAIREVEQDVARGGSHTEASLGYFLARAGRRDEATAVLDRMIENAHANDGESFSVVVVLAGLGDVDEAFVWLDRAVKDHSLTFEAREPRFSDLHADPRFRRLLNEVGLGS
jgi:tetratricopeptide (TPR) repeat protein